MTQRIGRIIDGSPDFARVANSRGRNLANQGNRTTEDSAPSISKEITDYISETRIEMESRIQQLKARLAVAERQNQAMRRMLRNEEKFRDELAAVEAIQNPLGELGATDDE